MNTRSWTIGLAFSFVIALASGEAEAKELKSKGSFSGTVITVEIDTNSDNQKAILYSLGLKGTLGSATAQVIAELQIDLDLTHTITCENGHPGLEIKLVEKGPADGVRRYDSTGDLLFFHFTSISGCFDLDTQIQYVSGTAEITGGTGRFEGARGTINTSGTGKALFQDGAGNFFVPVSGTYEDVIIRP